MNETEQINEELQAQHAAQAAQNLNIYLCLDRHLIGSVLVETTNMAEMDRVKFYLELGCQDFKESDNRMLIKIKATDNLTIEEVEEITIRQLGDIIYKCGYLPMMRLCYTHDEELVTAL